MKELETYLGIYFVTIPPKQCMAEDSEKVNIISALRGCHKFSRFY